MKAKLKIEELSVETFATATEPTDERGTVRAFDGTKGGCVTQAETCMESCLQTCNFTCDRYPECA